MLSAKSVFEEIRAHDEAFRFFVTMAAKGEAQGGWENQRIAALATDDELRPKIARHGEDEAKHGRLFTSLLRRRGLEPAPVPIDADYCMQLEKRGVGLAHARLHRDEPLSDEEILEYFVHSRVTEQRAAEEVDLMVRVFGGDPEIGPIVKMIADDEVNHLSYCHEELLRLAANGNAERIRSLLKRSALVEIDVYRRVGLSFVDRMATHLGWGSLKRGLLRLGIRMNWIIERLVTWRRMVKLLPPVRPRAMG